MWKCKHLGTEQTLKCGRVFHHLSTVIEHSYHKDGHEDDAHTPPAQVMGAENAAGETHRLSLFPHHLKAAFPRQEPHLYDSTSKPAKAAASSMKASCSTQLSLRKTAQVTIATTALSITYCRRETKMSMAQETVGWDLWKMFIHLWMGADVHVRRRRRGGSQLTDRRQITPQLKR